MIHEPNCTPSWWGELPLPPVRPRYHVVFVSGYTTGGPGSSYQGRKLRTTWTVHDRLNQGFAVGVQHYMEKWAEVERAQLEAEWERRLVEMGYVL